MLMENTDVQSGPRMMLLITSTAVPINEQYFNIILVQILPSIGFFSFSFSFCLLFVFFPHIPPRFSASELL